MEHHRKPPVRRAINKLYDLFFDPDIYEHTTPTPDTILAKEAAKIASAASDLVETATSAASAAASSLLRDSKLGAVDSSSSRLSSWNSWYNSLADSWRSKESDERLQITDRSANLQHLFDRMSPNLHSTQGHIGIEPLAVTWGLEPHVVLMLMVLPLVIILLISTALVGAGHTSEDDAPRPPGVQSRQVNIHAMSPSVPQKRASKHRGKKAVVAHPGNTPTKLGPSQRLKVQQGDDEGACSWASVLGSTGFMGAETMLYKSIDISGEGDPASHYQHHEAQTHGEGLVTSIMEEIIGPDSAQHSQEEIDLDNEEEYENEDLLTELTENPDMSSSAPTKVAGKGASKKQRRSKNKARAETATSTAIWDKSHKLPHINESGQEYAPDQSHGKNRNSGGGPAGYGVDTLGVTHLGSHAGPSKQRVRVPHAYGFKEADRHRHQPHVSSKKLLQSHLDDMDGSFDSWAHDLINKQDLRTLACKLVDYTTDSPLLKALNGILGGLLESVVVTTAMVVATVEAGAKTLKKFAPSYSKDTEHDRSGGHPGSNDNAKVSKMVENAPDSLKKSSDATVKSDQGTNLLEQVVLNARESIVGAIQDMESKLRSAKDTADSTMEALEKDLQKLVEETMADIQVQAQKAEAEADLVEEQIEGMIETALENANQSVEVFLKNLDQAATQAKTQGKSFTQEVANKGKKIAQDLKAKEEKVAKDLKATKEKLDLQLKTKENELVRTVKPKVEAVIHQATTKGKHMAQRGKSKLGEAKVELEKDLDTLSQNIKRTTKGAHGAADSTTNQASESPRSTAQHAFDTAEREISHAVDSVTHTATTNSKKKRRKQKNSSNRVGQAQESGKPALDGPAHDTANAKKSADKTKERPRAITVPTLKDHDNVSAKDTLSSAKHLAGNLGDVTAEALKHSATIVAHSLTDVKDNASAFIGAAKNDLFGKDSNSQDSNSELRDIKNERERALQREHHAMLDSSATEKAIEGAHAYYDLLPSASSPTIPAQKKARKAKHAKNDRKEIDKSHKVQSNDHDVTEMKESETRSLLSSGPSIFHAAKVAAAAVVAKFADVSHENVEEARDQLQTLTEKKAHGEDGSKSPESNTARGSSKKKSGRKESKSTRRALNQDDGAKTLAGKTKSTSQELGTNMSGSGILDSAQHAIEGATENFFADVAENLSEVIWGAKNSVSRAFQDMKELATETGKGISRRGSLVSPFSFSSSTKDHSRSTSDAEPDDKEGTKHERDPLGYYKSSTWNQEGALVNQSSANWTRSFVDALKEPMLEQSSTLASLEAASLHQQHRKEKRLSLVDQTSWQEQNPRHARRGSRRSLPEIDLRTIGPLDSVTVNAAYPGVVLLAPQQSAREAEPYHRPIITALTPDTQEKDAIPHIQRLAKPGMPYSTVVKLNSEESNRNSGPEVTEGARRRKSVHFSEDSKTHEMEAEAEEAEYDRQLTIDQEEPPVNSIMTAMTAQAMNEDIRPKSFLPSKDLSSSTPQSQAAPQIHVHSPPPSRINPGATRHPHNHHHHLIRQVIHPYDIPDSLRHLPPTPLSSTATTRLSFDHGSGELRTNVGIPEHASQSPGVEHRRKRGSKEIEPHTMGEHRTHLGVPDLVEYVIDEHGNKVPVVDARRDSGFDLLM
ncbi:hypothetical protein BGW38_000037 [Lunasporangiospora selenospora]|uniref:Uncharacterized protein n=1 Tax=Lunasporangiospora selenospora TaxID=979761 RepID=A0A9P6G433_9FUNG|nr:hypothetical protein BGW38_000037 [Lunasporangiospora selenospora]